MSIKSKKTSTYVFVWQQEDYGLNDNNGVDDRNEVSDEIKIVMMIKAIKLMIVMIAPMAILRYNGDFGDDYNGHYEDG